MKRPFPQEWARGHRQPLPAQIAAARALPPLAPVKALFYGSALLGLVAATVLLEGAVMLADALEAHLRG